MNSDQQYIQIISVQPIYEPKEKLKGLVLSPQILKYYLHNEVSKFKYTCRKDTKLNEEDPTLWWLKENVLSTSTQLPDVINFYPVVSEYTEDISPLQNAINTVRERLDKLKTAYSKIEATREVVETDKSLIQGTIDAGVLGGLPKYKKFYSDAFIETNPKSLGQVAELKVLIIETINWGESFLDLSLEYLPNDDLLSILKQEQLPKLKSLFDMPLQSQQQPMMRRRQQQHYQEHSTQQFHSSQTQLDSTPKASKQFSLNESTSSSRSFLKQITQVENYPGRSLMSYIGGGGGGGKNSTSNQMLAATSSSNRDSVASIKSLNSDDENGFVLGGTPSTSNYSSGSRTKIILDETVNPKRPLRPGRNLVSNGTGGGPQQGATQNSSPTTTTSNHSSRPVSHLSSGGGGGISTNGGNNSTCVNTFDVTGPQIMNSVSMQHILLNNSMSSSGSGGAANSRRHTCDDDLSSDEIVVRAVASDDMPPPPPPPKPPKTATLKLHKFNQPEITVDNASFSSENLLNPIGVAYVTGGLTTSSVGAGGSGGAREGDIHHHQSSSNSLNSNSVQFRYLSAKTTSDSILNRLPEDSTNM